MSYTVIEETTETHQLLWPFTEEVSTTVTLVKMKNGELQLKYRCNFSATKQGLSKKQAPSMYRLTSSKNQ